MEYFIKNSPNWSNEELRYEINIFKEIYKKKPIFDDIDVNFEVSKDELSSYNYITYIKLK